MPENYITSQTEKGNISISEDVIQVMVNAAVSEIEGVAGLSSVPGADIAEFLGIKSATTPPSVKIAAENGQAVIDILIMVRYGYGVTVVAKKVHITGIAFDKTDMKG